jgi:hypothetical protein
MTHDAVVTASVPVLVPLSSPTCELAVSSQTRSFHARVDPRYVAAT